MDYKSTLNIHCILVFDFGLSRIGIATANTVSSSASALKTISATNGNPNWKNLDNIILEWEPDLLVLGLPYNRDGSESAMITRMRKFGEKLSARYEIRVEKIDEYYSSKEAKELLIDSRKKGIRTRRIYKEDVDSIAAKIIAERWLEKFNSLKR
ncbi:MAG: Holliday junction resolvase RuvX [Pseudomonadota bacterium]|nr:Holliday junction resolvase RuvX [Pseudomonadota bacterium]